MRMSPQKCNIYAHFAMSVTPVGVRLLSQGGKQKLVRKYGCHSYIFTSKITSQILKTGITHKRVRTLDSKRKKKTCQKMWLSLVHVYQSLCRSVSVSVPCDI